MRNFTPIGNIDVLPLRACRSKVIRICGTSNIGLHGARRPAAP